MALKSSPSPPRPSTVALLEPHLQLCLTPIPQPHLEHSHSILVLPSLGLPLLQPQNQRLLRLLRLLCLLCLLRLLRLLRLLGLLCLLSLQCVLRMLCARQLLVFLPLLSLLRVLLWLLL